MQPLSPQEINNVLPTLHVAWSVIPGEGLVRVWGMPDFAHGMALSQRLAKLITTYDSQPTLLVTHNMVQLALAAKEIPGITAREVALAEAIDNVLSHDSNPSSTH